MMILLQIRETLATIVILLALMSGAFAEITPKSLGQGWVIDKSTRGFSADCKIRRCGGEASVVYNQHKLTNIAGNFMNAADSKYLTWANRQMRRTIRRLTLNPNISAVITQEPRRVSIRGRNGAQAEFKMTITTADKSKVIYYARMIAVGIENTAHTFLGIAPTRKRARSALNKITGIWKP